MKLKHLQGIWKDIAESYQRSFASEIAGWYYSRYCLSENMDKDAILEELQRNYPNIVGLESEPFTVTIHVEDAGLLKIKYRSTGTQIGYTYSIETR